MVEKGYDIRIYQRNQFKSNFKIARMMLWLLPFDIFGIFLQSKLKILNDGQIWFVVWWWDCPCHGFYLNNNFMFAWIMYVHRLLLSNHESFQWRQLDIKLVHNAIQNQEKYRMSEHDPITIECFWIRRKKRMIIAAASK